MPTFDQNDPTKKELTIRKLSLCLRLSVTELAIYGIIEIDSFEPLCSYTQDVIILCLEAGLLI